LSSWIIFLPRTLRWKYTVGKRQLRKTASANRGEKQFCRASLDIIRSWCVLTPPAPSPPLLLLGRRNPLGRPASLLRSFVQGADRPRASSSAQSGRRSRCIAIAHVRHVACAWHSCALCIARAPLSCMAAQLSLVRALCSLVRVPPSR